MARTPAGAALTSRHHAAQQTLRARTLRDFTRLWPLWSGDEASFRRLLTASLPLVRVHHQLSSATAGAYYERFRRAEQVARSVTVRPASLPDEKAITGTLFVTGQQMTRDAIAAGQSPDQAMRTALVRTSGSVTRLTSNGGRDTLLQTTSADPEANGWVRVTSGDPCAFCALIASRGPVFSESSVDFQAHDHCSCFAEPSYEGSEWPGRAKEFRSLYNQHAKGTQDPLNSFRRVLEGRA